MGIVFHVAADLCNCCRSSAHHDKTHGKEVDDYPVVIAQQRYDETNRASQVKIPFDWNCGKCSKHNPLGKEFCIFCDEEYKPEYRVTAEPQGEVDVPDRPIIVFSETQSHDQLDQENGNIAPESIKSEPEPGNAPEFVE